MPEPVPPVIADNSGIGKTGRGEVTAQPAPSGTAALFLVGLVELLAIAGIWRIAGWNLPLLLAVHALALAGLGLSFQRCRRRGEDSSMPFLGLLASFAVGPAGAIGTGCLALLVRRNAGEARLLADWYERISLATAVDPVTRHCDNVSVGRAMNLTAAAPASFLVVIETGTLAERQTILGIVARRFHEDYLPVLQAALRSTEPVIRVQAAAVAAHVRPEIIRLFKATVAGLPSAAADPARALQLLRRLEAMTTSGLLDESDRLQGLEVAARLGDIVLAAQDAKANQLALTDGGSETLERLLLARGRFAELRCHRSARRAIGARPGVRVRRLAAFPRPVTPDAAAVPEMRA